MALEQIGLAAILDDRNFQNGLKSYTKGVGQMTKVTDSGASMMTKLGSVMQGALVVGVGAATAAFAGAIAIAKTGLDATLAWAEQLDKLGDQFGMSGEVASGWAFLMNRVGLSVDEGAQGLNYFTNQLGSFGKTMKDGTLQATPFSDALKKLGINAIDPTTKKVKTFDQLMPEIMDKFEKLPAGIDASALAMDLFGTRGGTKFLDFLRQGGKGLDEAKKKAKEFGLELSTDEVNAAEEFGFAMNELNLEFTGFKNTIGRYVLPIAKELVRWISVNAIPKLIELAKKYVPLIIAGLRQLGNWVVQNVLPQLERFTDWIRNDAIPFVQRLADAFQRGGLTGLFTALGNEFKNAWPTIQATLSEWGTKFWNWLTGPGGALEQAGGKIAEFAGGLGKAFTDNWPTISAQLVTWKDQFWNWLTGPDGAIFQAATKIGEVAKKIADWLSNNWDGLIKPTLMGWVGMFWEWISGKGGVIDTIASTMVNLTNGIADWTRERTTQKALNDIGRDVALAIFDGIGNLFKDQGQSDSVMLHLINSLNQARINLAESIANIGGSISAGLITGAVQYFFGADAANRLKDAINTWMTAAIKAFVFEDIGPLAKMITDALFGAISGNQPAPPAPNLPVNGPGGVMGPGFQHGGYVPTNMLARLHAGEYVIPASRVSNITHNTRTIGEGAIVINFPSTGGLSQKSIRDTVYVAVREVLDAA